MYLFWDIKFIFKKTVRKKCKTEILLYMQTVFKVEYINVSLIEVLQFVRRPLILLYCLACWRIEKVLIVTLCAIDALLMLSTSIVQIYQEDLIGVMFYEWHI